jgi:hypothetical protein
MVRGPRERSDRRLGVAAVALTLLAVLGAARSGVYDRFGSIVGHNEPEQSAELRECPLVDTIPAARPGQPPTVVQNSVARENTDVPEYHDCQKLLVDGGRSYGPLAAVFASKDLARIRFDVDSQKPASEQRTDEAAALVRSIDGDYAPLGISPGYSCLYLWKVGIWRAKLVHVGAEHGNCLEPINPNDRAGVPLEVKRSTVRGLREDRHYPPVARWDWDPITQQQYIGIKCGAGWCEVGPRGFNPSKAYTEPTAGIAPTPVLAVKGWYDEQYLAIPNARSDRLVPGPVMGTVIPAPNLGSYETVTQFSNTWRPVAFVALSQRSPQYEQKFNFRRTRKGAPLQRLNRIEFCYGTRALCVGQEDPLVCNNPSGNLETGEVWWARVVPAGGGNSMSLCVYRVDHTGMRVPATSRWRWLWTDETVWERCLPGCCEMVSPS